MIDRSTKFLIVGLGLMGGSYAKALSKKGYNVSALTLEQKDIDYALERGIIVSGASFPDEKLISSAPQHVAGVTSHSSHNCSRFLFKCF